MIRDTSVITAKAGIQRLDPGSKPVPDDDPGSGVTVSWRQIGRIPWQLNKTCVSEDEWVTCVLSSFHRSVAQGDNLFCRGRGVVRLEDGRTHDRRRLRADDARPLAKLFEK